jgi:hypothetical protein
MYVVTAKASLRSVQLDILFEETVPVAPPGRGIAKTVIRDDYSFIFFFDRCIYM